MSGCVGCATGFGLGWAEHVYTCAHVYMHIYCMRVRRDLILKFTIIIHHQGVSVLSVWSVTL